MSKDEQVDGGPAFPLAVTWHNHREGYTETEATAGMTLRDYLAAKALTLGGEFFHGYKNGCDSAEHIAEAAYQIADAMLAERSK